MYHPRIEDHVPSTHEEAVFFLYDVLEYLERRDLDNLEDQEAYEDTELLIAEHLFHFAYPHPGFHQHRCLNCEAVWEHEDDCLNPMAHTCPTCGDEQYEKYFGDRPKTHVGQCHFLAGVAKPILNLKIGVAHA